MSEESHNEGGENTDQNDQEENRAAQEEGDNTDQNDQEENRAAQEEGDNTDLNDQKENGGESNDNAIGGGLRRLQPIGICSFNPKAPGPNRRLESHPYNPDEDEVPECAKVY
jgi:hypothetical protein